MVQALNPIGDEIWLDPCIGPGAFVRILRLRGVPRQRIVGIDIDPVSSREDSSATTIRGVDFFDWSRSAKGRFSRIIANPPYVAIRRLHPKLQAKLKDFDKKDPTFSLSSNYWAAFLSASIRLLSEGGSLAFVLPAAWEYASYAKPLRETVNLSFASVAVHRCLKPLFPGVQEGCVVLIAQRYRSEGRHSVSKTHLDAPALIRDLNQPVRQVATEPRKKTTSARETSSFSKLFSLRIGCVTGDAQYFLLTESERVELRLPLSSVQPVVSKAKHLQSDRLSRSVWTKLLRANERIWMFSPNKTAMRSKSVQDYIEYGKSTCNLQGYKLRNREFWYVVPDVNTNALGFLSGMSKVGPWISFRAMRGLAATNTLYTIVTNETMGAQQQRAWALSLLSTPVRDQYQEIVRRYADGLPKLEPSDINALELPRPPSCTGAIESYENAVEKLLQGDLDGAVTIADAFIGV
ncbi:Eco57I restriction-modification methylase domain-containing protein [Edaphobacter bradus]|uniref:Eco57I restriction-modification methylase domain-containing protein n=1 Tax=Edaphobacter bradus TaxID=2259016 RepID=UPI0037BFEEE0